MIDININEEKEEQYLYSIEYLRSRLDYDPDTGIFKWKFKNGDTKGEKLFNSRFGGKETGNKNSNGYLQIIIDGKAICLHRIAYLFMIGEWPNNEIDHINGNPLDNRWENLREVSKIENFKNQKIYKNNVSGVTGVSWNKYFNKWIVIISVNKKPINLGYFDNFEDAVKVRKNAEVEHDYHENHGKR